MKMTTKIKIEMVEKHMPIAIETIGSDGKISAKQYINDAGVSLVDYVHSGQSFIVREATQDEARSIRIANLGDPDGCPRCGLIAGCCADYPNCPALPEPPQEK
jgi:hypothetical protein